MLVFHFVTYHKENRYIDLLVYSNYNQKKEKNYFHLIVIAVEVYMRIGEVGLLSNNVTKLANFYKTFLGIDNGSNDNVHQTIIAEETMLTIYNDNSIKNNNNQNMCLAFTVADIEKEYKKLLDLGVEIIEIPTTRPWGTINMSFYDPDRNVIYLRSFIQ